MRLGFEDKEIVYEWRQADSPKDKYAKKDSVRVLGLAPVSSASYTRVKDIFEQSEVADAIKRHFINYGLIEVEVSF
jgi:hypothetical protein